MMIVVSNEATIVAENGVLTRPENVTSISRAPDLILLTECVRIEVCKCNQLTLQNIYKAVTVVLKGLTKLSE